MTTYAVNRKTKEHRVAKPGESFHHPWQLLAADSEGWVEWYGGECPLAKGAEFEVKRRDGEKVESRFLISPSWSRDYGDKGSEIIAYRPILDAKPEPVEWDDEWEWEGLPPVGCECEATWLDGEKPRGYEPVLVKGRYDWPDDKIQIWFHTQAGDEVVKIADNCSFRSLRSEKERKVDEMVLDLSGAGCRGLSMKHIARKLYEIGYRKT